MRRSRRGKHSGLEFGGSGEDSFVAVVVTKLTGALLFILLLTMVIMALLPKAVTPSRRAGIPRSPGRPSDREPLRITTPGTLPDAVAGRPYLVALAATGGHGTPQLVGRRAAPRLADPGRIDRPDLRDAPGADRPTAGLPQSRPTTGPRSSASRSSSPSCPRKPWRPSVPGGSRAGMPSPGGPGSSRASGSSSSGWSISSG